MRYTITPRYPRIPHVCAFCDHLRWEEGKDPVCSIGLSFIDGMGSACSSWRRACERREE